MFCFLFPILKPKTRGPLTLVLHIRGLVRTEQVPQCNRTPLGGSSSVESLGLGVCLLQFRV